MKKLILLLCMSVVAVFVSAVRADDDASSRRILKTITQLQARVTTEEAAIASLIAQVNSLLAANASLVAKNDALSAQVVALTDLVNISGTTQFNARLAKIEANTVLALDNKLSVDNSNPQVPVAMFSGVNVQIVNGQGHTDTVNGTGNLIIGYDESDALSGLSTCSIFGHEAQGDCEGNGGIWGPYQRTGSHNAIIGRGHSYTAFGGIVTGSYNIIAGAYASVSAGSLNRASGWLSSVSGGEYNNASGVISSVSGGARNEASGVGSSVSGGILNKSAGLFSSVVAGTNNTASGEGSGISGGASNEASGSYGSVGGGYSNVASGYESSVSGGGSVTGWAAGSYHAP